MMLKYWRKVEIPAESKIFPLKYEGFPTHYSRGEKINYLKGIMFSAGSCDWQEGGQKMIYAIEGILDILEEDIKDV